MKKRIFKVMAFAISASVGICVKRAAILQFTALNNQGE